MSLYAAESLLTCNIIIPLYGYLVKQNPCRVRYIDEYNNNFMARLGVYSHILKQIRHWGSYNITFEALLKIVLHEVKSRAIYFSKVQ